MERKFRQLVYFIFVVSVLCLLSIPALFSRDSTRPKLIIGITIDQMRWDFLYRFKHRWHANGGFGRLLSHGLSCDNTLINYTPSFTACGHTSIYTGSVPAIHGITGNNWWDRDQDRYVYCTGDDSVRTVGSSTDAGNMSPRRLLTTTICDELRLATNFRSKTIGIAIKDRGGILAAGQSANAAYWYDDDSGEWVTSTYYMNELPAWVKAFRTKSVVDSLYRFNWNLLYPRETYVQSVAEGKSYELRTFGSPDRQFPYDLNRFAGRNYSVIPATPYGNTLTTEFAKAAIMGEGLGTDTIPDFLAVSYSSTDYIGHAFGPNSVEVEDTYIRLDLELGAFLDFLDQRVGKGEYLVFLSSDHGISHIPGFLKENKLPYGYVDNRKMNVDLNEALKNQFKLENLVKTILNFEVILDIPLIERNKKISVDQVMNFCLKWFEQQPQIIHAVRLDQLEQSPLPEKLYTGIRNGYLPERSGHIFLMYRPGYFEGYYRGGTTHGTLFPYDTRIPLLWYGWHVPEGKQLTREIAITDIAPTLAALLNIQEPNGSVGKPIKELLSQKE